MKELKGSVESLVLRGSKYNRCFIIHIQDTGLGLKHGGLLLVVFALEFLFVQQEFGMGLGFLIAGVIVALFPSNYEIRGMEEEESS